MKSMHLSFLSILSITMSISSCGSRAVTGSNPYEIKSVASVRVSDGIPAWNDRIKANAIASGVDLRTEGYTECAAVEEIKGAFLCGSNSYREMNQSLGRASLFTEGLFDTPKGTVVSRTDSVYNEAMRSIGGHDLLSKDLTAFWSATKSKCTAETESTLCANPNEKELFGKFIEPKITEGKPFVLVSYAVNGIMPWTEVVTHEIMHAQYFMDPRYQETSDKFWEEKVSDSDKTAIKRELGQYYNADDALLMRNEFQAYILMSGAESNLLSSFVRKYREPLLSALREKQISPIQVQD